MLEQYGAGVQEYLCICEKYVPKIIVNKEMNCDKHTHPLSEVGISLFSLNSFYISTYTTNITYVPCRCPVMGRSSVQGVLPKCLMDSYFHKFILN